MISWEEFEKVEMRSGTILSVKDFPEARKPAYQLSIDFGSFGIRQSSAQLTHNYTKEDLIGQQVIAVVNFPPKRIAGFKSECLVLGLNNENEGVVLIQPGQKVPDGQRIY